MQPITPAEAAEMETEVVVEETEVAEEVIIAVTTTPNLIKILILSTTVMLIVVMLVVAMLIAVRRRRKVFVSSLLTVRTFINMHEKCETAHRKTTLYALSAVSDRILLKSAHILVINP
jgi:uncharacterized membrane protein